MKIEHGKHHITRDGQVVGPVWLEFFNAYHCWTDGTHKWRIDGRCSADMETPFDLVGVAPDQPAPGPSAFVRETAARIMASMMGGGRVIDYPGIAADAVQAAIALEKALQEAGK